MVNEYPSSHINKHHVTPYTCLSFSINMNNPDYSLVLRSTRVLTIKIKENTTIALLNSSIMLTRQNQEIPFTLAYISLQNKRKKNIIMKLHISMSLQWILMKFANLYMKNVKNSWYGHSWYHHQSVALKHHMNWELRSANQTCELYCKWCHCL